MKDRVTDVTGNSFAYDDRISESAAICYRHQQQ